jgi:hypothetical protein
VRLAVQLAVQLAERQRGAETARVEGFFSVVLLSSSAGCGCQVRSAKAKKERRLCRQRRPLPFRTFLFWVLSGPAACAAARLRRKRSAVIHLIASGVLKPRLGHPVAGSRGSAWRPLLLAEA